LVHKCGSRLDLPWTKIGRAAVCFRYNVLECYINCSISRFDLRDYVHQLGRQPSNQEKINLSKRRHRLQQRLETFSQGAAKHLGYDIMVLVEECQNTNVDESDATDDEEGPPSKSTHEPENWIIPLPSSAPLQVLEHNQHISKLLDHENQLREGLANDALEGVRGVLSQLAWQFRFNKASGNRQTFRARTSGARKGVNLLQQDLRKYRRSYNHNQSRMIVAKGVASISERYPILTKEDCKISTIIHDPNAPGQSYHALPWFWTQIGSSCDKEEYLSECGF
jgi:hypothetical protein